MTIPLPLADASGGYMVIKYTNGTATHRTRVHVAPFNLDATGTYVTPPSGGEASVAATFAALTSNLAYAMNNAFTMSLDQVFQIVSGSPVEVFSMTAPATVAGGSGTAASPLEVYESFNMKTLHGHPFRIFLFQRPGAQTGAPTTVSPINGGTGAQNLCYYLQNAHTQVVGRDGYKPNGTMRVIDGYNRKLRRKNNDA